PGYPGIPGGRVQNSPNALLLPPPHLWMIIHLVPLPRSQKLSLVLPLLPYRKEMSWRLKNRNERGRTAVLNLLLGTIPEIPLHYKPKTSEAVVMGVLRETGTPLFPPLNSQPL